MADQKPANMSNEDVIEYTSISTRISFGVGSIEELKNLQYRHALVICSGSLPQQTIDRLKELLTSSTEKFVVGPFKGEPTGDDIDALLKEKSPKTDCIIGIGGGSYLDAAKALALQLSSLNEYTGDLTNVDVLPIVAVPTTAGTGSELSKGSVIKRNGVKGSIRSNKVAPVLAIVDPQLCESLPLGPTLYTGFDALTHAVETYTSKKSTEFTRMLSERTIRDVFTYLPKAKEEFEKDGKISIATRSKLSFASMIQGINLANSSTCLPHRIQYGLSSVSDATHPEGLASIYHAWLRLAQPVIAGYTHDDIISLMDTLGVTLTLKDIGIGIDDIPTVLSHIGGTLQNDPTYKDDETIRQILEGSL